MRKLLKITTTFVVALIFTAGMAFGQNNADVDQSVGSAEATIEQTNDGNSALLTQQGNNLADIDQHGNNTFEGFMGANRALQKNWDGSSGDLNEIDVDMNGRFSTVGVTQEGRGSEIDITQEGGINFVAQVEQLGTNNDVDIRQTGNQYAKVTQDGASLTADVTQGLAGPDTAPNDKVLIDQDGFMHNAVVTQVQPGGGRNGNTVDVTQSGNSAVNNATVNQFGGGNTATITQSN
jgi:hypothetical protein